MCFSRFKMFVLIFHNKLSIYLRSLYDPLGKKNSFLSIELQTSQSYYLLSPVAHDKVLELILACVLLWGLSFHNFFFFCYKIIRIWPIFIIYMFGNITTFPAHLLGYIIARVSQLFSLLLFFSLRINFLQSYWSDPLIWKLNCVASILNIFQLFPTHPKKKQRI